MVIDLPDINQMMEVTGVRWQQACYSNACKKF